MTGKAYYITTLADWQRHAPRFANSHFIVLDDAPSAPPSAGCRSAGFQPANLSSVEAPDFLALSGAEGSPAKSGLQDEGLQPRASGSDECWQKVTVSCEPSHQFFAGRHSASILTHNYTFSS